MSWRSVVYVHLKEKTIVQACRLNRCPCIWLSFVDCVGLVLHRALTNMANHRHHYALNVAGCGVQLASELRDAFHGVAHKLLVAIPRSEGGNNNNPASNAEWVPCLSALTMLDVEWMPEDYKFLESIHLPEVLLECCIIATNGIRSNPTPYIEYIRVRSWFLFSAFMLKMGETCGQNPECKEIRLSLLSMGLRSIAHHLYKVWGFDDIANAVVGLLGELVSMESCVAALVSSALSNVSFDNAASGHAIPYRLQLPVFHILASAAASIGLARFDKLIADHTVLYRLFFSVGSSNADASLEKISEVTEVSRSMNAYMPALLETLEACSSPFVQFLMEVGTFALSTGKFLLTYFLASPSRVSYRMYRLVVGVMSPLELCVGLASGNLSEAHWAQHVLLAAFFCYNRTVSISFRGC